MKIWVRGLTCILGMAIFILDADGGPHRWVELLQNQSDLDKILKQTGAYCDRLGHSALYFVCRERIEEESHYQIINYTNSEKVRLGLPFPPTVRRRT